MGVPRKMFLNVEGQGYRLSLAGGQYHEERLCVVCIIYHACVLIFVLRRFIFALIAE